MGGDYVLHWELGTEGRSGNWQLDSNGLSLQNDGRGVLCTDTEYTTYK